MVEFGVARTFMARIALTVYLMVAAAAGPWLLCCCMPSRAAELFTARKPTPPPEEDAPKCCCKHHKPAQPQAPKKTPSLPGVPCNCKDTQPIPFVTSIDRVGAQTTFANWLPAFDTAGLSAEMGAVLGHLDDQLSEGALALPPRSCRDILATLHILRC
jgi:hypothetical protein